MSITRDDVLRELELLPAWKLRAPVESVLTQKVAVEKLATPEVAFIPTEEPAPESPVIAAVIQYEITLSQDKQWAFICGMSTPTTRVDIGLQSILFNNILHALSIEKPSKMQMAGIADVQARMTDIKILVAMGESAAQALLNAQEPLEILCGKLHPMGNTQLIATWDLAHLLNYPLDKAKVWQDLCLARSYLQGLRL